MVSLGHMRRYVEAAGAEVASHWHADMQTVVDVEADEIRFADALGSRGSHHGEGQRERLALQIAERGAKKSAS